MDQEDTTKDAEWLLRSGINVMGGVALGMAADITTGLVAGATVGAVGGLIPVVADMLSRALSKNENRRVSSVANIAIEEFKLRIAAGSQPRADGFFDFDVNGRHSAEEIFEGVLQIARAEYEEGKLPYLAHLYVSIVFDSSISRGEANRLIRQLELLTYQKICILTAASQKPSFDPGWRTKCFNMNPGSDELGSLMQDCFELETQGLLIQENYDQSPFYGTHSWAYVVPAHLKVAMHGKKLIDLAQLLKVPEKDTYKIHEIMSM